MSETGETGETRYILPAAVRDAVLNYLGRRPYNEVASGMKALLDLEPLPTDAGPAPGPADVGPTVGGQPP